MTSDPKTRMFKSATRKTDASVSTEQVEEQEKEIGRWGWAYMGDGKWHHAESEASGHWQGNVFVNEQVNKYYDPSTGEVHDMPG